MDILLICSTKSWRIFIDADAFQGHTPRALRSSWQFRVDLRVSCHSDLESKWCILPPSGNKLANKEHDEYWEKIENIALRTHMRLGLKQTIRPMVLKPSTPSVTKPILKLESGHYMARTQKEWIDLRTNFTADCEELNDRMT
ncbi:hypothetical protein Tco_1473600 [Tanacetum coccineum]